MLRVENLTVSYGAALAVRGATFEALPRQVTALLGANGAGKTTTMLALSGLLPVRSGVIIFNGAPVHNLNNERLVQLGIVQVPQGRQVFAQMSVLENLELGAFVRRDREIKNEMARVFDIFPRLAERSQQSAGTLSGGEQQMLAIGRALMARPKLLILDEPSLGLAPIMVDAVYAVIARLAADGLAILLAEQDMTRALSVAARSFVLENGAVIAGGTGDELAASSFVQKAYLG
ncbi:MULTISPECIES: ABC transporter ATP-binding protein [Rhodopseudomonas]|uniref:Amino acid ABC transporter ATPase n=1 Tax=Rhodopseudomonas palustris TaxID=1076 RepID=A0A0D7E237_RHOPL|nr:MULTISPECIES: ABC transporter ATP-binding protein [Rhodopseudomonas]KIZ34581.1 amino acid ABC transporter ATPase [Rhodopseudomonas palustris]MDF3809363.1 ABC transporter ATP-binding protein [Rhodopseudomonas sp. BAL398]WOK20805.1 ABC transporter ATP-binding protein [Rhodopseudomonas sp. BAL398]